MIRLALFLALWGLSGCTYPPGDSCPADAGAPRERPADEPQCGPGWRLLWREANTCLILRGSGLGDQGRWDCTADLECSGDWLCVPEDAHLESGDPNDCACEFRP